MHPNAIIWHCDAKNLLNKARIVLEFHKLDYKSFVTCKPAYNETLKTFRYIFDVAAIYFHNAALLKK